MNFEIFKLDLEKEEKPEIKLPTSVAGTCFQDDSLTWPVSRCWLLAGSSAKDQRLWFLSTWTSLCGLATVAEYQGTHPREDTIYELEAVTSCWPV